MSLLDDSPGTPQRKKKTGKGGPHHRSVILCHFPESMFRYSSFDERVMIFPGGSVWWGEVGGWGGGKVVVVVRSGAVMVRCFSCSRLLPSPLPHSVAFLQKLQNHLHDTQTCVPEIFGLPFRIPWISFRPLRACHSPFLNCPGTCTGKNNATQAQVGGGLPFLANHNEREIPAKEPGIQTLWHSF
jgi:hypothetical protein